MLNGLDRDTEHLLRYRAELGRRLSRHGVQDVTSLVSMYARLRAAMEEVSAQEIAWASERLDGLVRTLEELSARLTSLRRLKGSLDR